MTKEIFTEYYYKNTWAGQESVSGPGSDYEQVKHMIPELQYLLDKLQIKSMFDAPCGDFNWMKRLDLSNIQYTGADIVSDLIEQNRKRYKKPNISFIEFDMTKKVFPAVDLVFVRDCLVHLPNEEVKKTLNNIKNSGSKYLLTTHFTWDTKPNNKDILFGAWRRINLTKPPFNFPFPEHIIVEGNRQSYDHDKTLGLWKIKNIPQYGDNLG